MSEETWLFDNLLLTYLCVSNRGLCGFLLPWWCWGDEGLAVEVQALRVGCWKFGTSGFLGSRVWDLEMGSSGPFSFSVRELTLLCLAENLWGFVVPFYVRSHWQQGLLAKSLGVIKHAENAPELGAIISSVSFRNKKFWLLCPPPRPVQCP